MREYNFVLIMTALIVFMLIGVTAMGMGIIETQQDLMLYPIVIMIVLGITLASYLKKE